MNPYELKQEAKRERLLDRADRAEATALAADRNARSISDHIPFGQPILVGHHSEKRHRRDIERITRGHEKAHKATVEAENLRRRAAGVGTAGVSSDDPEAVDKLQAKLADMEAKREQMKAANAEWRKAGKPQTEGAPSFHQAPFPAYALTNLGGNIRRVKGRIEALRVEDSAQHIEEDCGVCSLVEDPEENRVQLVFEGKPPVEVRAIVKQWGFRWSRTNGAWQRHLNNSGRYAARACVAQIERATA